jgi:4-amino-4-deoxy-L-arabinose transferase-like glycosyltransferase
VLGIAFLFALPVLLWALARRWLDADLRIAASLALVLFVFWLFSSQQIRFLLPALPALAVAMAASGMAAERWTRSRLLRWLFVGAAAAGVPVILAWFATLDPVRVVLGGESRSTYLARRLDYYRTTR